MKTIDGLLEEMKHSDDLRSAFVKAAENDQLEDFLKDNDCDFTILDMQRFLEAQGKLDDEELEQVGGGMSYDEMVKLANEMAENWAPEPIPNLLVNACIGKKPDVAGLPSDLM